MLPIFSGIDHVHIYAPDKQKAIQWYSQLLGFKEVKALSAEQTEAGPFIMQDSMDSVHLAIFETDIYYPSSVLAFKSDGKNFLKWKSHLDEHGLLQACKRHAHCWSLYFNDPFGHEHEIASSDMAWIDNEFSV